MSKQKTVVGLMSGTSLDGIDAAIIMTDGETVTARGMFTHLPYAEDFRERLRQGIAKAHQAGGKVDDPFIRELEVDLTGLHADAVKECLDANPGLADNVSLVGFHGQTLFHAPDKGITWQLGDGARLAKALKLDVVYDFRAADVAAGGEGAPFAPLYHRALFQDMTAMGPVAVLNIGGVSNLTWIYGDDILAFDCGPGNALLDDWIKARTGKPYDEDGKVAALGEMDEEVLKAWTQHPYFSAKPPKSLDRNAWPLEYLEELSVEDGAATLTAFTVGAILKSGEHLLSPPVRWIVSGGGRHNAFMMNQLSKTLKAPVVPIEDYGLDGDAIEAEAFAFLGLRSALGLPLSVPKTTGVKKPTTGGVLVRG